MQEWHAHMIANVKFFGAEAVGTSSTRMVLAHSATRGSRSSIFIPAYFTNICGSLRRREPTLFMTVHREIAQNAFLVKRISYLACDDTDTLIPPCASHFTNDERRRT